MLLPIAASAQSSADAKIRDCLTDQKPRLGGGLTMVVEANDAEFRRHMVGLKAVTGTRNKNIVANLMPYKKEIC